MKKSPPSKRNLPVVPPRHEFEHATPTVIHHPEEDMTALARAAQHVIDAPAKRLMPFLAVAVGVLLAFVIWNAAGSNKGADAELWAKLEAAQKSEDLLSLAKENPGTSASTWALYRAAGDFYNQAMLDMPNNRDVALPLFKRALDLFDQVATEAPKDSPLARASALAKARTLEARNEIPKAIEQYRLVAKTWPKAPEATEASTQAALLEKPEAVAFYKELYSFTPTRFTLPSDPGDSPLKGLGLPPAIPELSPPSTSIDLPPAGAKTIRIEPAPSAPVTPAKDAVKIEMPKPIVPTPAKAPK